MPLSKTRNHQNDRNQNAEEEQENQNADDRNRRRKRRNRKTILTDAANTESEKHLKNETKKQKQSDGPLPLRVTNPAWGLEKMNLVIKLHHLEKIGAQRPIPHALKAMEGSKALN